MPKYNIIEEITLLRAIGILLVVFGHSDIFGQQTPALFKILEKIIYSFHMPLFMFISGFVFLHTNFDKKELGIFNFLNKKIHRLLIPSFFILTIAYILRKMLAIPHSSILNYSSIYDFFRMFFFKHYLPIEFFWYIFTLFNIFLLSSLLIYSTQNKLFISMTSCFFIFLNLYPSSIEIFFLSYTTKYIIFFWFGCIFCLIIRRNFNSNFFNSSNYNLLRIFIILMFLILLNMYYSSTKVGDLACAICGILFCIIFVFYIKNFNPHYLFLIGKFSYQIFLISWFFHRVIETIGYKIFDLGFWITFPLSFTLSIIGPILVSKIILAKTSKLKYIIGL